MREVIVYPEWVPILQAVQLATGVRPHIQSIRRWIKKGVRGIRLEVQFVNGKYLTTVEAVRAFIAATTEARLQVSESPKIERQKPVRPARVDAAIKEFARLTSGKRGAK